MKSILFIIPWSDYYKNNTKTTFADSPERAPEGVVGLATFLKQSGFPVQIADMMQILRSENGNAESALNVLWNICMDFHPDVIGFSFFTARFKPTSDIFYSLKSKYISSQIQMPYMVGGGVHPTLLPQLTLKHIQFDALIIGEGEYPLMRFLNGEAPSSIKGFYFKGDKEIVKADIIKDLDALPFPDWNLINKKFYLQPSFQISNTEPHTVMPISFSRSCTHRCNFCAHGCFLAPRHHSPDYFVKKMEYVAEQCNINTFVIQDSSIGNFRKDWETVCHHLINLGSPYKWWANLRADQADEEFLILMQKAGCIKLFFGFESGSDRILKKMNKLITVEQCLKAAELCHKINLAFYTSYIINYPGEKEEDLKMTESLIIKTRPTSLAVNKFSPIPGSKDYDNNKDLIEPYLKTIDDWNQLGMLISPLLLGNMSEDRFNYWYGHFRSLKEKINKHEGNIHK